MLKNYSLFLWNSILSGWFVFYLATLTKGPKLTPGGPYNIVVRFYYIVVEIKRKGETNSWMENLNYCNFCIHTTYIFCQGALNRTVLMNQHTSYKERKSYPTGLIQGEKTKSWEPRQSKERERKKIRKY